MRVAVVGCGLIGTRRALAVHAAGDEVALVVDLDRVRAEELAPQVNAQASAEWCDATEAPNVDAVCIATVNASLAPIAVAALEAGKHVLCEKPLGRSAAEAESIIRAATAGRRILMTGFSLRFHPGIAAAHALVNAGRIGRVTHIRAAYGHGGRPGYEHEWRGNPELAGGGELLDQGVHLVDLVRWFMGEVARVYGSTTTVAWPIQPLEDNAFATLHGESGAIATMHTSWTQWRNIFRLEVFGEVGDVIVEGLGGSYGQERLTLHLRRPEGGRPDEESWQYPPEDPSWALQWAEFHEAVAAGRAPLGDGIDGWAAARIIDAIYASARQGIPVAVASAKGTAQ